MDRAASETPFRAENPGSRPIARASLEALPRSWSAQLGAALILVGIVALSTTRTQTFAPEMLFAWLIVFSGIVEAVHAFHVRRSAEFFLHIMPAIAGVPMGLLIAVHPAAGAIAWMLLLASYFTVIGLFRIIAAFRLKFPGWTWMVFDGAVTLLLGTILWTAWPWLGPPFFGLAVGLSLIARGWSSIMSGRIPHNFRNSNSQGYTGSLSARRYQ